MARATGKVGQPSQVETLQRIDPDEDFSDVDGDPRTEFALTNEDPDRQYIWAHNDPDDIGRLKGGVLGYKVEYAEDGGVNAKMHAGYTPGEVITKRDHVLMSCDRALWEKKERFEAKKTKEANERMFKKNSRSSIDLRR